MSQEINLLKKGQFYFIYDGSGQNFVVEDKTKRGLPVVENNIDDNIGVITEKGRFYDANGQRTCRTNKMVLSQGKLHFGASVQIC